MAALRTEARHPTPSPPALHRPPRGGTARQADFLDAWLRAQRAQGPALPEPHEPHIVIAAWRRALEAEPLPADPAAARAAMELRTKAQLADLSSLARADIADYAALEPGLDWRAVRRIRFHPPDNQGVRHLAGIEMYDVLRALEVVLRAQGVLR